MWYEVGSPKDHEESHTEELVWTDATTKYFRCTECGIETQEDHT